MGSADDLLYYPPSELLTYTLLKSLHDLKHGIEEKLHLLECSELSIYIASYKIYEETSDFKQKINEIKLERDTLLSGLNNSSNNSFVLNELDKKIANLEDELSYKICFMNQEKIKHQNIIEKLINDLDLDLKEMKVQSEKIEREIEIESVVAKGSQLSIIQNHYSKALQKLMQQILKYEKLQLTFWKVETSEQALGEILEKQGLKFTSSGQIFTADGDRMSFRAAEKLGLFSGLDDAFHKVVAFVKNNEPQPANSVSSTASTIESFSSSEDVKYLKHTVGKPLTLALAEIVSKHPSDPIHYLGHYLFKYRYNQEIEQVRKDEIDELTKQRNKLAKERWHQFVEEEARNAVISMVIRAEEIIYQKELKRIEEEMMAEENEEEENDLLLQEEARDKFE